MDSNYRPQSPDLSSYAPRSPDLSGFHSQGQDLSAFGPPAYSNFTQQGSRLQGGFANHGLGGHFGYSPTSVPQPNSYAHPPPSYLGPDVMPPRSFKTEPDGEYLPDAATAAGFGPPSRRLRKPKPDPMGGYPMMSNGMLPAASSSSSPYQTAPFIKSEPSDPTLGCQLKTSFPVARIKRIMQADEDIGKVAQVTPTVVSRALELFMIKLISASAHQARGGPSLPMSAGPGGTASAGGGGGGGAGGASKGPRRVLAQHLKKAVMADDTFDFLHEIVNKVPDAPTKAAKKETGSDSEDGAKVARRKGKKRKDSMED